MDGPKVEVRTTVTSSSGSPFVNHRYFITTPGILKFVQVLLGVICICLASDAHFAATYFFLFVCWTAMILTCVWILVILLRVNEKMSFRVSWIKTELGYTIIVFLFYVLAMILQFNLMAGLQSPRGSTYVERHTAAAVFALFNSIAYAFGAVLLFVQSRG